MVQMMKEFENILQDTHKSGSNYVRKAKYQPKILNLDSDMSKWLKEKRQIDDTKLEFENSCKD